MKMMRMLTVTLGVLLQVAAVSCLSFCPTMPSETLRNMVVAGSNVIVGSSSALYRPSPDLVEVESVMQGSPNRLLVAEGVTDGMLGGIVLACGTTVCNFSLINNLSDIFWQGGGCVPCYSATYQVPQNFCSFYTCLSGLAAGAFLS